MMAKYQLNLKVDAYLAEGCMRCKLGGSPDCKVHSWEEELKQLRTLLLDSGLTEEVKWSMPCYTYQNRNIVMMSAFKEYCSLNFFKGSMLKDDHGLLVKPGENTQTGRQIRFTNVQAIVELTPVLKIYLEEAIQVELSGTKPKLEKKSAPIPGELQAKFGEIPALKVAFEALTPGRQRAYIIYFSQPQQSQTRMVRIEKCVQSILEGKGLRE